MQADDEAAARGTLDRVSSLYANAPFVQQQIARTAADLGLAPTPSAGGARGPSEEQVAAAAEMSEAERGDMIAAMVAGLDQAQPVRLSEADARRIGVSLVAAERKSLTVRLEAVGVATYDETRLRVVNPKVEGWVEHLHVEAGRMDDAEAVLEEMVADR